MTTNWDDRAIVAAAEGIAREIRRLDAMGARHSGRRESFDDFAMDRWSRPAWAELNNEHHDIWLLRDPTEELPGVLVGVRAGVSSRLGRGMLVGPASGRWDGPGTLMVGLSVSDTALDALDPSADDERGGEGLAVAGTRPLRGGAALLPGASAPELVTAVETAIRTRLATYIRCRTCRVVKPPEWGGELCYSCMQEQGVVF